VSRAWECLLGKGANECTTAIDAVNQHHTSKGHEGGDSDEFLPPTRIRGVDGAIRDGDSVVFFNFRGDRPRELVKAFLLDDDAFAALPRGGFERHERPRNLFFATMAEYETGLPARVIFARAEKMPDILGAWIAAQGLRQFRCAETEKFPHVTFFFNDYREEPFEGEVRTIIPSPRDVATYDLKPEMSALGVRDAVLARIAATDCEDLLIVNFANCDMVGHTGSLLAAIRAVQVTDECVGAIVDAVLARNGSLIVTADHGNVEQMRDPATGAPHTAHTNFTVPLMVIGRTFAGRRLRDDGRLADVAPTLLDMMGLPQPAAITGRSLLQPS
jgi:2,3-bisphosphoglycerate-independent phosphoglycerate mutase